VAAIGRHAEAITRDKERASALGRGSSYEVAIKLGARVLLLGVGNNSNSALHYAEVAADLPYNDIPFREFWGRAALVQRSGRTEQVPLVSEFPGCSSNFPVADGYLRELGIVQEGKLGAADCKLMDAGAMVEAVVRRLKREPAWLLCSGITCEPCSRRKVRLRERGLI
jgi:aminoglycoside N3'-acetyltransferase